MLFIEITPCHAVHILGDDMLDRALVILWGIATFHHQSLRSLHGQTGNRILLRLRIGRKLAFGGADHLVRHAAAAILLSIFRTLLTNTFAFVPSGKAATA